ncbi:MAG: hypothetical protein WCD43_08130 [Candidatus Acidiferrales bacterium]
MPDGSTYLRDWAWLMPEKTYDVELVCGDWLGGAEISGNRKDTSADLAVFDEGQGAEKFELRIPESYENRINVRRAGLKFVCTSEAVSTPVAAAVSRVYVNMDGYA